MGHLAKPRDASFFRVFFNPYRYGVLTIDNKEAFVFTAKASLFVTIVI